ncbi:MAG: FAD binding domain-containing protein [Deltaproteobacteria bacterium]|nr:FAD binding domain-containing protein [Deltaproteobacteria bacterium]
MRPFNHTNATSIAEIKTALADGKTTLIAGGTDLVGTLKDNILRDYPSTVINLKTVPGMDYIKEEGGVLKIGAATHLADIAADPNIQKKYTALAQAASRVATPHIRDMGTIAGNIAQLHRCWYFRKPENRFDCKRKGGNTCFAMTGDNRYHSIFGAVGGCIAVHPSDTAPALIALNAKVVTDRRQIEAENFFDVKQPGNTVLEKDEVITEIQIPAPPKGAKSAFIKFALRKSIDFPIVNCAVMTGKNPRVCLNAVAPKPYRAIKAEEVIKGKKISEKIAEEAGTAAVADARPLNATKFKVQIARVMVKRAILAAS